MHMQILIQGHLIFLSHKHACWRLFVNFPEINFWVCQNLLWFMISFIPDTHVRFVLFFFYQPCLVTMVFVGSLLILQQWEYYWQCGIFMLQVPFLLQTPSIKCLFRLIAPWFCHIESLLSYYYFRSFSECFYIFSLLLNFVPFHQGVTIPLNGITTKFWVFLKMPVEKKSRRLFMWYIYFFGIWYLYSGYHLSWKRISQ